LASAYVSVEASTFETVLMLAYGSVEASTFETALASGSRSGLPYASTSASSTACGWAYL
jgi:hypothetical protein